MSTDIENFECSLATYLKSKGYSQSLQSFLLESPYLAGRTADDFTSDVSTFDFDNLTKHLRSNAGTHSLLSQAITQVDSAMATIKFSLGLTHRRPNNSSSNHTRFYNNYTSTVPLNRQPLNLQPQRQAQTTKSRKKKTQHVRVRQEGQGASSSVLPAVSPTLIEAANQAEATPIRQHFGNRVLAAKEVTNATTPTRRQLFASPNKRKTPNPKHQLTPLVERDLLDEALKQASISPSDWDRRLSDSALPQQLAAAINTVLVNVGGPLGEDGQNGGSPLRNGHVQIDEEQRLSSSNDTDVEMTEQESDDTAATASGIETDAVISETLYHIGTNPDFFQSLEQLILPEYNVPEFSAMDDEMNRFNDLHTPEPWQDDFNTSMRFNHSATSSTIAQFGDTPRHFTTPAKSTPIAQSNPTSYSQTKTPSTSSQNGNAKKTDATKPKQKEPNSVPTTELLTPDRIDALMKRLHRKK